MPTINPSTRPHSHRPIRLSTGTAFSFEGRTGTGGQLGHGNDFDYWSPNHVEWLQLGETDWTKQQHEDGSTAWKVVQVSVGRLGRSGVAAAGR